MAPKRSAGWSTSSPARDLDGIEVERRLLYGQGHRRRLSRQRRLRKKFDGGNLLLTAGYRHRSRLDAQDRDWAVTPFESVNYGGWSGNSNLGNFVANTAAATLFHDNGCAALGGQLTITPSEPWWCR